MNRLDNIIAEFLRTENGIPLGGVVLGEEPRSGDSEVLKASVRALKERSNISFATCVAMIVALFVSELIIVFLNVDRPEVIQSVVAVFGISTSGLIGLMVKLWRDRDRQATVIAIAEALQPEDLRGLLHTLLDTWYKPSRRPP